MGTPGDLAELKAEILDERSELHVRENRLALAHADLEVAGAIYRRLGAVKRQQRVDERRAQLSL